MFATLYNTGARVSELTGLRVVDVVLDGSACVHLHGKGRKDRSVPLWRATTTQLRQWLPPLVSPNDRPPFPTPPAPRPAPPPGTRRPRPPGGRSSGHGP